MAHLHRLCLLILPACAAAAPVAQDPQQPVGPGEQASREVQPTIEQKTRGMQHHAGLFDFFLDPREGRIWLRLPPAGDRGVLAEVLYAEGLTTGLGSNPVGLDRGAMKGPWVVRFRSVAGRVVLERPNLRYRASSEDSAEARATEESFATSVLFSAQVAARDEGGALLVDLTPFVVRDAHDVVGALATADQGSFSVDPDRSLLEPDHCHAFPDNVELEALLTFKGRSPGSDVRATAPDPTSISLIQHHSFIRLPDDGYRPRRADPRSGSFALRFLDYAAGLDEPIERAYAVRHRLVRTDPQAATSGAVEPIVYYVDRGAPEPVRGALLDGARWWAEAFEAVGFEDAFRVELLPEGAHPLDVRYNVIQWVHRSTRGWSYGNALSDPRSGEIIKGHVSLGSLRVRQDRVLFEGLLGVEGTGSGRPDDPIELSLARIRQLAAHEVGHTLGFAHNFTASTYGGRASVMDYPAPLIRVRPDGTLDTSDAYGVGLGSWDLFAVRWLYAPAPADREAEESWLDGLLEEAHHSGLRFHSDSDARPADAAQPYSNLWDNFADPISGLQNTLAVRAVAMGKFGAQNLADGLPLAHLEEVFTPVYFHHRYQLEAVVKLLGGVDYEHSIKGDGRVSRGAVSTEDQRRALALLLSCLQSSELDVPEAVLTLLAPRPPGERRNREQLNSRTGPTFDALGAASTLARLVVDGLLNPGRCARIVDQHRRDPDLLSLEELLEALTDAVFQVKAVEAQRQVELQRVAQAVVVHALFELADDPAAPHQVRARVSGRLRRLVEEDWASQAESEAEFAHATHLLGEVRRFLDRRAVPAPGPARSVKPPPGSPIGDTPPGLWGCCSCPR